MALTTGICSWVVCNFGLGVCGFVLVLSLLLVVCLCYELFRLGFWSLLV